MTESLAPPAAPSSRPGIGARLRNYLLTGLLALAPSALTLYAVFWAVNWTDNLLGQYLKFKILDYHRIPGAGILATLVLLLLVGWMTSLIGGWIGGRSAIA